MSKAKNPDLKKVTLNLRDGDLEKMKELFPTQSPSVSVRDLLSGFVDKYYEEPTSVVKLNHDL
jgi:hypothetical protein|tara:strand:+ start:1210 stop:1398 length:189 start_codon:yes stop_codon:yes gene_type:complete